jgi:TonB-dependent SusC/RagA subfamily outer membrane receptor
MGESEVLISEGLGPAVFGLFRPRIVLPPWTLQLDQEELGMVLLHEKEHQLARDPAVLTFGLLMATLTPWNPAIWWMARRLHLAVEGDCDGRVLSRGVSPTRYGNLLLEVAAGSRGLSALAPALAEGGQTFLERRLLMIRSNVRKHSAVSAIFAAFLGGGLILLACETPTPPAQAEDAVVLSSAPLEQAESPGLVESEPLKQVIEPEAEDGYYLVRKDGGNVEVIRPVEAGELKLVAEGSGEAPAAFVVKEKSGEGEIITLRRTERGEVGAEGLKPLYIVDGVILSDGTAMEDIDKMDIASVNVIKGAAAVEQYGERAKNGVILITTKG